MLVMHHQHRLSRRLFATATTTTTESTLTFGRLDRKKAVVAADKWLRSEGAKFRNQKQAKFVGAQGAPFPMNPLFKPVPPLSNASRDEIYALYTSNPETETPLKLAAQFGISIVRVQAILRLKALQQQMERNNKPIQVQLTYHMEKLLRVDPRNEIRIKEPLRALTSERLKPLFQFIDEADAISPLDAAQLLEKEPYANVAHKLDQQAERIFSLDGPSDKVSANVVVKELERDPKNASDRFKFAFVDISKVEKQPMYIRDTKGTLRTASKLEVYKKKTTKPAFFM
ncbi:hypothetical protein HDU79_003534 [Rhizoclosmatium sp. JEL0117]|nr:hypothetical protein HDU79_003534 [Rhizoclosmatium sp. JEL0117]